LLNFSKKGVPLKAKMKQGKKLTLKWGGIQLGELIFVLHGFPFFSSDPTKLVS
jgi:hypothetical protein